MLHALCPRCRIGHIFKRSILRGFAPMYERCQICDLKFEREQGYFLGAMYISYALAVPIIAIFAWIVWRLTHWSLAPVLGVAALIFLPLAPVIALFSRVLWIYVDRTIDPD